MKEEHKSTSNRHIYQLGSKTRNSEPICCTSHSPLKAVLVNYSLKTGLLRSPQNVSLYFQINVYIRWTSNTPSSTLWLTKGLLQECACVMLVSTTNWKLMQFWSISFKGCFCQLFAIDEDQIALIWFAQNTSQCFIIR